jgi:transcriptional regulator with XRE-family HTH domain
MARTFQADLEDRLKDPDFAKGFGAARAKSQAALALAKARRNASMSQKTLAERTGYSQPYIAKLEGGEANPTLAKIGIILAAMGQRVVIDTAPLAFSADTPIQPTTRIKSISYDYLPENLVPQQAAGASSYTEVEVKKGGAAWLSAVSTIR